MISSGGISSFSPSLCSVFFELIPFTSKFSLYGLPMTVGSSQEYIPPCLHTTGGVDSLCASFPAKVSLRLRGSHWLTRLSLNQSF